MNWFKAILTYLPVVLQTVTAVENALKAIPGQTKKDIVLKIIKTGIETGKQIPETDVQALVTLVDTSVDILNSTGVFNHETKGAK